MALTDARSRGAASGSTLGPAGATRGGDNHRIRIAAGLLLAVASGGLANLAFPPFGLWPLILVAFVPMVVAQHRILPPRWSGLAIGLGIGSYWCGQFTPGLSFSAADVSVVVQLLPLYVTIIVSALAWRSRAFQERTAYRWFLISMPLTWVGIDALRTLGNEVMGGTFGNPVYALYAHPALLQPVSVFGIWGLELLILLVNWAAAAAVIALIDRRRVQAGDGPALSLRAIRNGAAVVTALAVVWCVASVAMLRSPRPTVRVAAVQTGLRTRTPAERDERFRRDVEQTREAARRARASSCGTRPACGSIRRRERTDELARAGQGDRRVSSRSATT